mmetsp:Transcript_36348/g.43984  ORF Transcript_36348/g.43984 Transcript_36348/m.43984 type:complete len:99 (-) Transcript_36348:106-402(-)
MVREERCLLVMDNEFRAEPSVMLVRGWRGEDVREKGWGRLVVLRKRVDAAGGILAAGAAAAAAGERERETESMCDDCGSGKRYVQKTVMMMMMVEALL